MEHDIEAIRNEGLELLNLLKKNAHFDLFLNGDMRYDEWLHAFRAHIPAFISFSSGCTRLVFWNNSARDYVFKMNIYVGQNEIDYGKQEEYIYQRACEWGVQNCFAWTAKIIEDGMRSIYAMDYCHVDGPELSAEAYELFARQYCIDEGWDYDDLTDDQREDIGCALDDGEYAGTEGMLAYAEGYIDTVDLDALRSFINHYQLNDLHCGNWGFRSNQEFVIVDYAGWERELIKESV